MTRTRTITPRPIAVREERLFGHGVIGSAAAWPIAVREERLFGHGVIGSAVARPIAVREERLFGHGVIALPSRGRSP